MNGYHMVAVAWAHCAGFN